MTNGCTDEGNSRQQWIFVVRKTMLLPSLGGRGGGWKKIIEIGVCF